MLYRKKPVVVEAFQYVGTNLHEILSIINGCKKNNRHAYVNSNNELIIKTLEGDHRANLNDFIIRGVHGEFYPCKPDIFAKTYEVVN
ncbi:hypothetical protein HZF24_11865 [Sedimentibacter hydroxybenzoicus DSM 7310]|uniref:Phage protein n=1 Tax=Sedimentibacter hydroxybenzoicus DSM 7310 TaxID=1123245 RepID=A0A974BK87_SEDHY|nr:hypothetical protein [Sedimentibacter hydroxybenzoicus]NYB74834.1 hypothetical protein [Sedimentibacter hydroxybenzoicus DSM 7310]